MAQRNMKTDLLETFLDQCAIIHKQGLKFHFVTKKMIKDDPQLEVLKDWIVITNLKRDEVITCYRNSRGVRHVKRKSKRLFITSQFQTNSYMNSAA